MHGETIKFANDISTMIIAQQLKMPLDSDFFHEYAYCDTPNSIMYFNDPKFSELSNS
jgi:hypothetical protein